MPKNGRVEKYPFSVGFPLRSTFNAGTRDCSDEGSVVAINSAVPYLLFSACFAYSTRVDVSTALPLEENGKIKVFNSKLELLGKVKDMPSHPADIFAMFEKVIEYPEYKTANLPFALSLYEIAIRYVAMHEAMHIILGHTGYLKQELGLDEFLEFSAKREDKMDNSFFHCLEFLSDRNAVRGITSKMLGGDYISEALRSLLDNTELPKNDYLLRCIVSALTLTFHLFPSRTDDLKEPLYSHPNPYLRMQWLAMEIGHEVGSQADFRNAVLMPVAHTGAAIYANFQTPGNWKYATEEDVDPTDGRRPKFTDDSYTAILELAKKWGDKLWKAYSPLYHGDGSGRL